MKLNKDTADFFSPKGMNAVKTTHLCIAAHQDDVEIMAAAPILECYGDKDSHFTAVVITDGAGSPRSGVYADCTDAEMIKIRAAEQKNAAMIGDYLALYQLGYTSAETKSADNSGLVAELRGILAEASPRIVYIHNLLDKHPTHVAAAVKAINAIRSLPPEKRPERVISCEVWRSLDWLCDEDKVMLDTSSFPNISSALVSVFDSQISGGKRYDLATVGRRYANATYFTSSGVDKVDSMNFGLDVTELVRDDSMRIDEFAEGFIDKFKNSALEVLRKTI